MDHCQLEEKIQSGEDTYHIRYVIIGDQAGGQAEDKQEGTTAAHQPLDAPEHQRQENDAVQPKNILLIDEDEAHQGVGAGKEQGAGTGPLCPGEKQRTGQPGAAHLEEGEQKDAGGQMDGGKGEQHEIEGAEQVIGGEAGHIAAQILAEGIEKVVTVAGHIL